jgi:hypothetical protein
MEFIQICSGVENVYTRSSFLAAGFIQAEPWSADVE